MKHSIEKNNIFKFLKAESIVKSIDCSQPIEIIETKNTSSGSKSVKIQNLNCDSKYWLLNPENNTFIESKKKKVERILLEEANEQLNIFLIEMKSTRVNKADVEEKFKYSLSWIYILLNLLNHSEKRNIKVYGIIVAQKKLNWNENDTLNILSSTSIRYKKKSFYTNNSIYTINFNEMKS